MFAFAELIVNCDQQYCANVNLISLELWGFLARPLCKIFERICCICSQLKEERIFWTVIRARCEEESPIGRIYCKVSVIRGGQLAASLEEEKTKSGSTTATLPSCKLLQLCSHNRNLMEKILATQCKDFTRFAVLQLVKARGSLLKCN